MNHMHFLLYISNGNQWINADVFRTFLVRIIPGPSYLYLYSYITSARENKTFVTVFYHFPDARTALSFNPTANISD